MPLGTYLKLRTFLYYLFIFSVIAAFAITCKAHAFWDHLLPDLPTEQITRDMEREQERKHEEREKIEAGKLEWEIENDRWARDNFNEGYAGTCGPPDRDRG